MKICSICNTPKEETEFNRHSGRKDGLQTKCRECSKLGARLYYKHDKKAQIKRNSNRKQKLNVWFKDYKKHLSCEKCGEDEPICLDFHHKDPNEKDFWIGGSVYYGYGKEKILEEISKCMILCANCHRKIHKNDKRIHNSTGRIVPS